MTPQTQKRIDRQVVKLVDVVEQLGKRWNRTTAQTWSDIKIQVRSRVDTPYQAYVLSKAKEIRAERRKERIAG